MAPPIKRKESLDGSPDALRSELSPRTLARLGALAVGAMSLFRNSVLRGPESSATRPRSEINLQWLIHLRWVAIAGQAITVLVVRFGLGLPIPLAAIFTVIGVEFGTNVILLIILRGSSRTRHGSDDPTREVSGSGWASRGRLHALQLGATLLDTVLLALLLEVTGGIYNPFCVFLVIHVALAAVLLPLRHSMVAAGVVGVALVAITGIGPAEPLELTRQLQGWGSVVAIALTSGLTVLFVSRVTAALVRRSEQLEEERERQERRRHLEALGTLAAGAAHELGTPLSTIAIVAKELERRLAKEGGGEDDLADARLIRDEVARCRRILGRMSTDAGGGMGEEILPTDLTELSEQVIGEMAAASQVKVKVVGEGVRLELPKGGFATSIRAIAQNAVDASEPGGEVRLIFERYGALLTVAVEDDGKGMDATEVYRAMEPFFTTKDVGGGMGLGLYLASSFMESLGGGLEIQSALGAGTRVTATVPLIVTADGGYAPAAVVATGDWPVKRGDLGELSE